jgi:N-formylglutamate amidohydrolase
MKQTIPGVFDLWLPEQAAVPVVFDSPHSGADYPTSFDTVAPKARLRRAEDMFVETLFDSAPALGAALLAALFPRCYIDPNRALHDLDRRLIDGVWPGNLRMSEKSRLGHGLIWRICPPDIPMYGRRLSVSEIEARIQGYYRPYHRALRYAMQRALDRFGCVYHINCHSMPAVSSPMLVVGEARRRADFVLGDRDGASCSPDFTGFVRETLEGMGYAVAVNDPYKGVELVKAYSDPPAGRHSLQIEINRALYMDEDEFRPSANFAKLKADIDRLVFTVCDYAGAQTLPRAAE